ncbi:MAG TPA: polysaccharide pyruvyl transferase family protein [Candidatus Saccharimonadales bacterium]|nr:polysaccharide pyruvyl transferase family protein [Candidatus Saccharimonadales bacterium]
MSKKVLICGWFSFDEAIATIGDLEGCEVVEQWVRETGRQYDIAMAPYMQYGEDWRQVNPAEYDLLIFTTGPLKENELVNELLERFNHCTKWAVNVSLIHLSMLDKFDRVWVRDSKRVIRPEMAFVGQTRLQPLVAVAYAPPQSEYPAGRHDLVRTMIHNWLETRQLAAVELDMDMFAEHTYPRTPAQIESIIAKADVVVSMRLHATVLGLKYGKPVIACDPVSGGAKIYRQARHLRWPHVILPDDLSQTKLDQALQTCLSKPAAKQATASRQLALKELAALEKEFKDAL